jgi:hypothetical protein
MTLSSWAFVCILKPAWFLVRHKQTGQKTWEVAGHRGSSGIAGIKTNREQAPVEILQGKF